MKTEIISIGTEITTGSTLNTNAYFLSKNLLSLGIETFYQSSVDDNVNRIKEAFDIALNRANLILVTGGLGPTEDDMTKEILAEHLNLELIFDKDMKDKIIKTLYKYVEIPKNNFKQAYNIENGVFLNNMTGTAPGIYLKHDEKVIILLPGPPREMEPMFYNEVLPLIKQEKLYIIERSVNLMGIGESLLELEIKDLIHLYSDIEVATFGKPNNVEIKLIGRGTDKVSLKFKINYIIDEIKKRFRDNIFSYDNIPIENIVFDLLKERSLTLGFSESCTGGALSARFTKIPGASKVFDRGLITYSNKSKVEELFVSKESLKAYGAVSSEVAVEMAGGLLRKSDVDISVSTTGIAGPESDGTNKPVGLIYICIKSNSKEDVFKLNLKGSRKEIQNQTVNFIFLKLREYILENY